MTTTDYHGRTAMRIVADRERCIGAGQCALTAPRYFDQDDEDGVVVVLDDSPAAADDAQVREAFRTCPANALSARE